MIRLSINALWADIESLAMNAAIKQAAVAYVTDESRIKFGNGDILIVDASDKAIASGQTKAEVIKRAFNRGAKIYSLPNLHAKVMLLDEMAVIGSSNISTFSSQILKEAAIITDSKDIIVSVRNFIHQLKNDTSAQKVDKKFIKRIFSIPVTPKNFAGNAISTKRSQKKITLLEALMGQNEQLEDFMVFFWEGELELSESEVKKAAKRKGIILPPTERWERFEYSQDSEPESLFKRVFLKNQKKIISFQIQTEGEKLKKFVALDSYMMIYVNHFPVKDLIVVNFIKDGRAPFKLSTGKELCKSLSLGLQKNPTIAKRLYNKNGWITSPKEIAKLLD